MDNKRFGELATSATRWVYEAHRQILVAKVLLRPELEAKRRMLQAVSISGGLLNNHNAKQALLEWAAIGSASCFHCGVAIENVFKARMLLNGTMTAIEGKIKGVPMNHDVLAMVKACHISLNEAEEDKLTSIGFCVKSLGKYPIANDVKTQNTFTGRSLGGEFAIPLTERICLEILHSQHYATIFEHGALSGIEDTA